MNHLPATPVLVGLVLGGVVLGLVASWGWRWWQQRRARRRLVGTIISTGFEHLEDILVPDGNGGTYHVDFLILTPRGILVVDLRDVIGNIFGGDQMTDWTVMNGPSRHTFPNPQGSLYDRIAAVKALSGEVPVEGRIVFTRRARFPKGLPKWTLPVDALRADFPPPDRGMFESVLAHYRNGWAALRTATSPSPLGKPRPI